MIIRCGVECETCGHIHTARIGMGNNSQQTHSFSCKGCQETISVGLKIDFDSTHCEVLYHQNAKASPSEGTIVNLDALFVVEEASQHTDGMFSRLHQMQRIIKHEEKKFKEMYGYSLIDADPSEFVNLNNNFLDEWQHLKKTWSLSRNGKKSLANKTLRSVVGEFYSHTPPKDLSDWLWQFCIKLGGVHYAEKYTHIAVCIAANYSEGVDFKPFIRYLKTKLYDEHQALFFDIFSEYFDSHDSFAQVHRYCSIGLKLPRDHVVTSKNFKSVKMFYGNAYEVFTTIVEILACINNLACGRKYDQFETMDLAKYKSLDKSGRCNPFIENQVFTNICDSLDNKIRNASHHASFKMARDHKTITYKSKRGGGKTRKISYTKYIVLCEKIFLSLTVLMRLELLLSQEFKKLK